MSRRKPSLRNRVAPEIEDAIVTITVEEAWDLLISPSRVRSIWLRHDLETFKKRLAALDAKVVQEGLILTESHDTYYVSNIKGVGRIYQQIFVDTYTKIACVKLYDRKNAIIAAVAFQKKLYKTLGELQKDVDDTENCTTETEVKQTVCQTIS